MSNPDKITIEIWQAGDEDQLLDDLAELLKLAVHGESSVNFILPFSHDDAKIFWVKKMLPDIREQRTRLVVATDGPKVVGCALLCFAVQPNQQHRADVAKVLVHPNYRRQGIARRLMIAIEDLARAESRSLLVLDTVEGSPAQSLYEGLGWIHFGTVPAFALHPSNGKLEAAAFFYKQL